MLVRDFSNCLKDAADADAKAKPKAIPAAREAKPKPEAIVGTKRAHSAAFDAPLAPPPHVVRALARLVTSEAQALPQWPG